MNLTNHKNSVIVFGVATLLCLLPAPVFAQRDLIQTLVDFLEDRNEVEWLDLANRNVSANGIEQNGALVDMRKAFSHNRHMGDFEVDVLHVQVRPAEAVESFGITGRKVIRVPDETFIQFQGALQVTSDAKESVSTVVIVETRAGDDWVQRQVHEPRRITDEQGAEVSRLLVLDLSEWRGQEIRLSLSTEVNADIIRVGNATQLIPAELTADWYMAKLVSSPIGVVVGNPESVGTAVSPSVQGKTLSPGRGAVAAISDTTTTLQSFELVLEGKDTGGGTQVGLLYNPSDAPITSVSAPANAALPERWVSYFTARLIPPNDPQHGANSPETEYGASTRVIDFANDGANDLFHATVTEIRDAVWVNGSGEAIPALSPSGDASLDFDDHYAGMSSAIVDTLDDDSNVIHGFFHTEDHFQFENTGAGTERNSGIGARIRIGYARSIDNDTTDFGRVFSKVKSSASSHAIITYATPEEDLVLGLNDIPWGTGQPSAIKSNDGFYYLYYTSCCITRLGRREPTTTPNKPLL